MHVVPVEHSRSVCAITILVSLSNWLLALPSVSLECLYKHNVYKELYCHFSVCVQ